MTDMISAAWSALDVNTSLVLLLVKATVLLLAATAVTVALRRASAGTRHLIWLVALASLFLVPVLSTWTPVRLAVLPPMTTVVEQALVTARQPSSAPVTSGVPAEIGDAAPASIPGAPAVVDAVARPSLLEMILLGWVVGVLVLLALLARATWLVSRIVRRSTPLDTKDWLDPLYEVSDRLHLQEPPRLVRSADAKIPFACGLVRPTIVLPPRCGEWSSERRRAVMLHELAHVRRRDLVGHMVGRLACAVYWFHPLVWAAAKRLRSESERACDDIALASGARATDYAEHLLDIVTSVRRDRTPAVAMAMAQRREFEGRMLAILDPEIRRSLPDRRKVGTLVGTFALLSISIGAAVPAQRAAAPALITADMQSAETPATMFDAPARHDSKDDESFDVRFDVIPDERSATAAAATPPPTADVGIAEAVDGAMRLAGDVVSQTLREIVQPKSRVVTTDVARGAQTPDERADLLARVLRTDTSASLRRIAAWGLREHLGTDAAVPALAEALRRDPSARVREMTAWALRDAERDQTAIAALSGAVRGDADAKVRATAAWALGNGGGQSAIDALVAALRDDSPSVRMRAVWALGRVEPRTAPPALVAMLRDRDRKVRLLSAWALYRIEDPSSIDALTAAMRVETDAELRVAYVRALAALGEESVDAIRDLLDSPDPRLKSIAVRALAGGKATGPWPWPWPEPRPFP